MFRIDFTSLSEAARGQEEQSHCGGLHHDEFIFPDYILHYNGLLLEVRNLSKSFRTPAGDLEILRGITLSLSPGQALSIMGPSGSGKSTLLHILGVLDNPTSGTVTLDGENPFTLDEPGQAAFRNRRIGFLFQDHCLLPQCTLLENVQTPCLASGSITPQITARARRLLERVGLTLRLNHRPGELSGGEKQRAALARALIRQPALLLCDEPTGNLDRKSADAVALLLAQLQKDTTIIVVTHSPDLAGRFPKRFEMHENNLRAR